MSRAADKLPEPQARTRADYKGTALAPYSRFRPTTFYDSVAAGGTFTGDIWGCPWRCDGCWSHFGRSDSKVIYESTPSQVVDRFLAGMARNGMTGARISGGDAGYWWPHVRAVTDEFLERTRGKVLEVQGQRRAQRMKLILETSGGITITPDKLAAIETRHGEHARQLWLSIGVKATNPELLAKLTGLSPKAAQAAHRRQMELVQHIAGTMQHVGLIVSFLDRYSIEDEYEAIAADLEGIRPGMGNATTILPFRNYR